MVCNFTAANFGVVWHFDKCSRMRPIHGRHPRVMVKDSLLAAAVSCGLVKHVYQAYHHATIVKHGPNAVST